MKVITGGAGFIGSNILRQLNNNSIEDILIVDDLTDGKKITNLSGCNFLDYIDLDNFIKELEINKTLAKNIDVIFHQGACSSTTEWNGKYLMANNYEYSKKLLHFCHENITQFIYASSASVYGHGLNGFEEKRDNEDPINMYAFSKFQFDQYVRNNFKNFDNQIVGLRYFNVYGPGESLKGNQASAIYHFINQIIKSDEINLFKASDGYDDGEQLRDFIHVNDCSAINFWFYKNFQHKGIFNVGTGNAVSFNDIANCIINIHGKGKINYIEFPDGLKEAYQSYTQSDDRKLRSIYNKKFTSLEDGIKKYYQSFINKQR